MSDVERKSGTCRACLYRILLNADGKIMRHAERPIVMNGGECVGSGGLAKEMDIYAGFKGLARVVVTDDAWPYQDKLPGSGRGAAKHYNTEAIDRIKATVLPPMEDDCVLFMWRVHSFAKVAYHVMQSRGFTYKTEIAWFKRNECSRCKGTGSVNKRRYVEQRTIPLSDAKDRVYDGTMVQECPACDGKGEKEHCGMGRIVRGSHEICLVGVRGNAKKWVCDRGVRSVFDTIAESEIIAPVGEHSEKPNAFYRLVETLFPGPYVEIHARKPRPGWFSVGHQLEPAEMTNPGIDTGA